MNTSPNDPTRVIIVGGGVAALEAMLAIRELGGKRVAVDLYAPRKDFVLKPLGVSEAFGQGAAATYDLETLAGNAGATFHMWSVSSVDREHRRVRLHDGSEAPYDYLVVAPGTKTLWVVPGAKTFWGLHGQEVVSDLIESIRPTESGRVLLTMPEPAVWPLPIYELALFLAAELAKVPDLEASIGIVTPEPAPLEAFGEVAGAQLTKILEESSVELITGTTPVEVSGGRLAVTSGEALPADAVITLPRLTGRHIDGLPYDEEGFLPVDEFGLIRGCRREYAAGDVVSYPIKFGGAATEQADVAASAVAASAWNGPEPSPFEPDLRATLLTPDGPIPLGDAESEPEPSTEHWNPAQKVRGRYLTPILTTEENERSQ